ncbi:MAG: putative metallo-hydrolase [Tenericutes bacterium ADurb.BinA124]|nr:MAG: putative metallo-hydrolase [Tenericutes bacterium ADurb.BinA124]
MRGFLELVMLHPDKTLNITTFISQALDANCYLVSDDAKMLVIDPCVSYDEVIRHHQLPIAAVLLTHAHFDHFMELPSYLNKGIKLYLHRAALAKLADPLKSYSFYFNPLKIDLLPSQYEVVFDYSRIFILSQSILVIETPGHTDCSLCFIIENNMFSGDTVFYHNIGRTDLYSGNMVEMLKSLQKIRDFKQNYQIYPGHGQKTTLEQEIKSNPYFKRSFNGKNY